MSVHGGSAFLWCCTVNPSRQRQVMFLNNVRLHSFFNGPATWVSILHVAKLDVLLLCCVWFRSFLLFNSMSLNRVARRVSFQKQLSGGSEHFWIVMSLGCLKTRDHPLRPKHAPVILIWNPLMFTASSLRHAQWSVTQQIINLSTIQPSVCRGF